MAFLNQGLPTQVEQNAVRRDEEDIEIVTTDGGFEVRNARSSQGLREYDISFPAAVYGDAVHEAVIALYKVARGKLHSFRFRDFTDYQLDGEVIGTGDASTTAFQVVQSWTVDGTTETRTITRPVSPLSVYKDGVLQGSGYTVDYTTGIVTFTSAPGDGVAISVSGTFDVPVRFDTVQTMTALDRRLRHIDTMTLREVREA